MCVCARVFLLVFPFIGALFLSLVCGSQLYKKHFAMGNRSLHDMCVSVDIFVVLLQTMFMSIRVAG